MIRKEKPRSVTDLLSRRIESGIYGPGDRLPPERELAHELVVSRAQIRSAIATLAKSGVLEQRPQCRPRVALLDQTVAKPGRIAVWMPQDVHDIGSSLILKGIRKVMGAAQRELIVTDPPTGPSPNSRQTDLAGAILWPSDDPSLVPLYREMIRNGVALVCIDRDPPAPLDADVIAADHFRGARAAASHLIELGHCRIAMVGNDDRVSSVRDRVDGYCSALRDAGIAIEDALMEEVAFVHADDLRESTERAICRLLRLPNPPTAILAVNDQIAMYLQDAIRACGLRVPEDISLAGFDWHLRWLPSGGDLTTVAQPFEEIGEFAAERLLARIEGSRKLAFHTLLPAPLVVKDTTKAPNPDGGRKPILPPIHIEDETYL
jgi:LacI family transcriptional regulator